MREYSSPETVEISPTANLTDDIVASAQQHPDAVAFKRRTDEEWTPVTAAEFLQQVQQVARGLIGVGIRPGDRVALLAKTRYEWTLADYAIWYVGGVSVPIYDTSSPEQAGWILRDSGARALLLEAEGVHHDAVVAMRSDLPELEHIWYLERVLETLGADGAEVSEADLEARRSAVHAHHAATIIYTSGTTDQPKGCVLTHANFLAENSAAATALQELFDGEDASTLLFLPLAHVFARVVQVGAVRARVCLGHAADVKHLVEDLETFRPSFILAVPRVFEKIFNTASQRAAAEGRGAVFDRAAETAIAYSKALDRGRPALPLRLRHALFERVVYARLRRTLGGRCRYVISGGAPLGERLGHFYRGIGLGILEGYGLTETTAAITVNTPQFTKIGTVGRPLPGMTIRVADDGEILAKGPQVFTEYWNNPTETADLLTDNGWLSTGDLGEIDEEGFIRVTGRKKDILVTAGGKNVAPGPLEALIRAHPLVDQCLVVGDGQPFVAALVTLDKGALDTWSGHPRKLVEASLDESVIAEVQQAVDEANKSVSQAESVRKFAILPTEWTEEKGHLTPSLKLKRDVLLRELRAEVADLYE